MIFMALALKGLSGLSGINQTAGGGGLPSPFQWSLNFSDSRNSFYLGTPGAY